MQNNPGKEIRSMPGLRSSASSAEVASQVLDQRRARHATYNATNAKIATVSGTVVYVSSRSFPLWDHENKPARTDVKEISFLSVDMLIVPKVPRPAVLPAALLNTSQFLVHLQKVSVQSTLEPAPLKIRDDVTPEKIDKELPLTSTPAKIEPRPVNVLPINPYSNV